MALDNTLLFKIKADGSQAKAEARDTARVVENAFDKDPFADFRAHMDDMKRRLTLLKDGAHDASKGVDKLDESTRRTGGRGGGTGQFIEALAQGDPGELLGEIAQNGGKAGIAVAGFTLAAAAAAVAIGAMTARMIELVRETDKLARETKRTSSQIQGLQVIANLTGESVEDLAENYKKLGPEVKRFEQLVKETGAVIDADLRKKTQAASLEWETFKLSAQGALNAIARESLPAVAGLLRELSAALRAGADAWATLGRVAGGVLGSLTVLLRQFRTNLIATLSELPSLATPTGAAAAGARIALRDTAGIAGDVKANAAAGFPNVPSFKGGGGRAGKSSKEDITETELRIRLLRAEQDEAQRGLNGTREAAQRLYEITMKLHAAEREQAQSELPRARAAKLAEIQQKEKEALEKYSELLKKVSDDSLKNIEALSDKINKDNLETAEALADQARALLEIKSLQNERRAIEADMLEQSARDLQRRGGDPLIVNERLARARAQREDVRFAQVQLSIERERQENETRKQSQEDYLTTLEELNRLEEAERRRHNVELQAISQELQVATELIDPLSLRSLFGDQFANLREQGVSNLQALATVAQTAFQQMSAAAGNFQAIAEGAIGTFVQGLGQMVQAFVLTGEVGPAALRKLTAAVLAQVAAQAAVKAIFELAEGFAALARGIFGDPRGFAEATAHFKSAALYGIVAGVAGAAGRAVAPSSSGVGAGAGGGIGSGEPPDVRYRSGSGYRGEERLSRRDALLITALENNTAAVNRLQAMPAGHVVGVGLQENPQAAGVAVIQTGQQDSGFLEGLGRQLRLA